MTLVDHAWDNEVRWQEIQAWAGNFNGQVYPEDKERLYCLFVLSRFMYFGKRLVREMLKSLYRDQFAAPLRQRIRRNYSGTKDAGIIDRAYQAELSATRFVGVGNPAESGAHLLYYFRQVNYLRKSLFVDLAAAFSPQIDARTGKLRFRQTDVSVSRYVFFDDLVGTGDQVAEYLSDYLRRIRAANPGLDLCMISLFATSAGLKKLNESDLFNGNASCLFELDDSFKAFDASSRYFKNAPSEIDLSELETLAQRYGVKLWPRWPLGYRNGQLLLGFAHNTPDNTLPIFWEEGRNSPWSPIFIRFDKK